MGGGGGGNWLVWMECRPAGWSVCLPLLILPCTIKSRSSLLAPAHPGGPGKRAVKQLWCGGGGLLWPNGRPSQLLLSSCLINWTTAGVAPEQLESTEGLLVLGLLQGFVPFLLPVQRCHSTDWVN